MTPKVILEADGLRALTRLVESGPHSAFALAQFCRAERVVMSNTLRWLKSRKYVTCAGRTTWSATPLGKGKIEGGRPL